MLINDIYFRIEDFNTVIIGKNEPRNIYIYKGILFYKLLEYISKGEKIENILSLLVNKYGLDYNELKKKINRYLLELENLENIKINSNKRNNNNNLNYNYLLPISISLLITYRCNLSCKHCDTKNLQINEDYNLCNELSTEKIINLIVQMAKLKVFMFVLNGGEPFVRNDIYLILEKLTENKIDIGISTNGIIFENKRIAEKMCDYNIISYNISIEGSSPEVNDLIRGYNSYNRIITGITNLINTGNASKIFIKVTYGKHNINDIENVVKLIHNMGLKAIGFARLKPWGKAKIDSLIPSWQEVKYVNDKILSLREKYPDITIEGDSLYTQKVNNYCAINSSLLVLPNGDVLPCRIFEENLSKEVIIGNIKDKSIFDLWNCEKLKQIRNTSLNLRKMNLNKENNCKYFQFCPSPFCIAYNYKHFNKFIYDCNDDKCSNYV